MFATLTQQPCSALYPQAWEQGLRLATRALKGTALSVGPSGHSHAPGAPVDGARALATARRASTGPMVGGEGTRVGEAQGSTKWVAVPDSEPGPEAFPGTLSALPWLTHDIPSGSGSLRLCLPLRPCTCRWAALGAHFVVIQTQPCGVEMQKTWATRWCFGHLPGSFFLSEPQLPRL